MSITEKQAADQSEVPSCHPQVNDSTNWMIIRVGYSVFSTHKRNDEFGLLNDRETPSGLFTKGRIDIVL